MRRLGIARVLAPAKFRGRAVAAKLAALVDSPDVARSCRAVADRFDAGDRPMERASEAIESLFQTASVPV